MSKEHKNKRDAKKKPAMSPKEKKAAKLAKKDTRNILGYCSSLPNKAYLHCLMLHFGIGRDRSLCFRKTYYFISRATSRTVGNSNRSRRAIYLKSPYLRS
jgi:hypothetical protein